MDNQKIKKVEWFFEKVNGKQFHGMYSVCDNFCVRLQIRKKKSYSWDAVAEDLKRDNYRERFKHPGMCTKDETRLVASYRVRDGSHAFCQWGNKNKKNNFHINLSTKKNRRKLIECLRKLAGSS